MGEIKTTDISELKLPELTGYREIRPENGTSFSEAQTYWNNKFSEPTKEVSPEKIYQDDNGKAYRIGDELIPDNSYEINGYKYSTDDKGRIVSAEGKLRKRETSYERDMKDSMHVIGKGDQLEGDERGHLIAHWFGGSDGLENLVPMEGQGLNKGDYKKMESLLADAVFDGADVRFKVEPVYGNDTRRPSEFIVTYSIDGDTDKVVFRNEKRD